MRPLLALAAVAVLTTVSVPLTPGPASGTQVDLSTYAVGRSNAVSYPDESVRSGAINAAPAVAPVPTMTAIAVGTGHSCALTSAGGVKCWGSNSSGQLGDGTTTDGRTPVDVVGLASGVKAITAGQASTCALTRTGGVKCWGHNGYGLLGNGSTANSSIPVDVVGLKSGVTAIAVGWLHTCALTTGGGVKCWGALIRDGSLTARTIPVDVFGVTSGIRAISSGYYYTCALTTGGGMKCWGYGQHGQLGNGTTTASNIPVDVVGLSSGVTAIAAGWQHTCALMSGGTMKCWGFNHVAQLGNGAIPWQWDPSTEPRSLVPVSVLGLTSAIGIAVGGEYTCALASGGSVGCWGGNSYGQLGDGTKLPSGSPVVTAGLASGVAAIAAGLAGDHTCALTTTGAVKCWGHNGSGRLGNGSTTDSSVPVDVDFTVRPTIVLRSSKPVGTIAAGTALTFSATVRPLRPAVDRATVRFEIYRQDSGVWSRAAFRDVAADATGLATLRWTFATTGSRYVRDRALGNAIHVASNWSPPFLYTVASFASAPTVTAITVGEDHSCALTTEGGVQCWGSNGSGQLGNGSTTNSSVPVDVSGLRGEVAAISAGGHTCAVSRSGGVTCWGHNADGRLGIGTLSDSSVPVNVTGMASGVAAVDVGNTHTCALTTQGGVKCWGRNDFGQLGNGAMTVSLAPVDVLGLASGVSAISAGGSHTCALTTAGGVKCWGSNYAGQLGNGTTIDSSTPVDVAGSGSGVVAITTGLSHTCALSGGGGVTCWGGLAAEQTDDGGLNTTFALIPIQVPGLSSGVASIAAGGFETCAVSRGGRAVCWGDNRHGQLGNGTTTLSTTPLAVKGLASGVIAMSASYGYTCALMGGGGVKCWGWNNSGELGDGSTTDSLTPVDVLGTFVRRPDGRVRVGRGAFVGNNVYNATGSGQSQTGSAARGGTIVFGISIENDGNGAEDFEVKAAGTAASAYTVRYFRGTTEITSAVVAGTYRTPSLAPAATYLITATVTVTSTATAGSSVTRLVTITSGADVPTKDTIKFIGKRA